jgi:hypothetical protein
LLDSFAACDPAIPIRSEKTEQRIDK